MWMPLLYAVPPLLFGLWCYSGKDPQRVMQLWPRPTIGFGALWAGLAIALIPFSTAGLLSDSGWRAVGAVLGILSGVFALVFLVSLFTLPSRLLPRWYRERVAGSARTDLKGGSTRG
jgi:hypothetical protein